PARGAGGGDAGPGVREGAGRWYTDGVGAVRAGAAARQRVRVRGLRGSSMGGDDPLFCFLPVMLLLMLGMLLGRWVLHMPTTKPGPEEGLPVLPPDDALARWSPLKKTSGPTPPAGSEGESHA